MSVNRRHLRIDRLSADGSIRPGHPAERASWIWAAGRGSHETALVRFSLAFRHRGGPLRLHVTADHRYQLLLDGHLLSCGPDRSDVEHWSVATLDVRNLAAGRHKLTALAWYIGEDAGAVRMDPKHAAGDVSRPTPPMAQMSWRAGFLLSGDGLAPDVLDTGHAPWRVADLTECLSMKGSRNLGYHDIGPEFTFDMSVWQRAGRKEVPAEVVQRPPTPNIHGIRRPGWVLDSTALPEQGREHIRDGRIRAARAWSQDDLPWRDGAGPLSDWQALLAEGRPVRIPPRSSAEVLWDLQSYMCGYPDLAWGGGRGARIELAWAESLFEVRACDPLDVDSPRGHRGEVDAKRWLGFGDAWVSSGAAREEAPALWWRAGRYVRIRVRTGAEGLVLRRLNVRTTGYPLRRSWKWTSSDRGWDDVIKLCARGLELGAHETWVDTPFYEQMMYVGDTALHALSNYVGYRDDRLTRRALDLFDASRAGSLGGLVAERYPCGWRQESATYAMLWPMMVRNHLMWRGDPDDVRGWLVGVRQLIESLLALRRENGLLGQTPGWPFVDWVKLWDQGCGPGMREGDSSIVNLHLVLALQAAAEVESAVGEATLATRCHEHARALFRNVVARYWDTSAGLLRDTTGRSTTSEHAQVLALLTGLLDAPRRRALIRKLVAGTLEARCTIYFSQYLLETLAREEESEAFFQRLAFWRGLPGKGFTSLPEMPDPCRSDCHGWGAHPLFHTFASIAGIRPAAPGMAQVVIRPMPGPLTAFHAEAVHPRGKIVVDYQRRTDGARVEVRVPSGVTGKLILNSRAHPIGGRVLRVKG